LGPAEAGEEKATGGVEQALTEACRQADVVCGSWREEPGKRLTGRSVKSQQWQARARSRASGARAHGRKEAAAQACAALRLPVGKAWRRILLLVQVGNKQSAGHC
jgi:hypothetical protein